MPAQRKILHIDMDAFFAAIEQRDHPDYRDRPLVVGGAPDSRGVVSTCSYEARRFGIHSAMPAAQAYRLCPQAIFVRPRFEVYRAVSQQIRAIFHHYTDQVESPSLDEAYLDVSAATLYKGSATRIAAAIRQRIWRETGLTASAGVSYNKFLAKMASDINKPNGLYVVLPERGPAFVETLPIGRFHGIGKVTEAKMHRLGIRTGLDLKNCALETLLYHFGKAGRHYYRIARAVDERPLNGERQNQSIGNEVTFQHDIDDRRVLISRLRQMLQQVMAKLQRHNLSARTLTIKVKYADFQQVTRSQTVARALSNNSDSDRLLNSLLERTEAGRRPVRLLGVTLSNLSQARPEMQSRQLELF